jgi:hypothetical protein
MSMTKPRQQLKDYVDELASIEGGESRDVIRSGRRELWPGKVMVAEVLNIDPVLPTVPDESSILYALTVYDEHGKEVESLAITPSDGRVDAAVEESDLFTTATEGAPDFMIQSFFARYFLVDTNM